MHLSYQEIETVFRWLHRTIFQTVDIRFFLPTTPMWKSPCMVYECAKWFGSSQVKRNKILRSFLVQDGKIKSIFRHSSFSLCSTLYVPCEVQIYVLYNVWSPPTNPSVSVILKINVRMGCGVVTFTAHWFSKAPIVSRLNWRLPKYFFL